jgi:ADP-glucose pyrophosphorylase
VESIVVCSVVDSVVFSGVVVESVTVVDSAMLAMVVVIKSEKTNAYLIINEGIK